MNPARSMLILMVVMLLSTATSMAQVRQAPEGNSPPDPHDAYGEAGLALPPAPKAVPLSREAHQRFARQVQLDRFRTLSVFDGGRAKILDTLAAETLTKIYGKPRFKDSWNEAGKEQSFTYDPLFTYLDLIFNKPYYFDKAIIYIDVLSLRRSLVSHLPAEEQEAWLQRGRLTPIMISDPAISQIIEGLDRDVLTVKAMGQVRFALQNFEHPDYALNLVSPLQGEEHWSHLAALGNGAAGGNATANPEAAKRVVEEFTRLSRAWQSVDSAAVNSALDALSDLIPTLNPETYPATWKRSAERLYNATHKFTIGYVGYAFGTILLLIAFAVQRRWLIHAGVTLFLLGFAVHTLGITVRGLLAGRWPIHNQYESYIAVIWVAVLVGLILMFVKRQWLFGAAASAVGAAALLFANTVDIPSREVSQVAGILATSRILYIHVNMVLASYGLISLGLIMSLFYLGVYYTDGSGAARFAAAGLGEIEADNTAPVGRQRILNDLDHAQMIVLQLAFWLLGVGILLGAYWADHAWGRWWAWDPKETWALITWIIYLMVIHLRLAVKRRGLVTAWMSVVGFCVMLWTYWGVNLLLAGLHSYA